MKNKLAIFDMDGTLFNTEQVNYRAYKQALNEHNYDVDYAHFCKNCNGRHYKEFLPPLMHGDISLMEKVHDAKKAYYSNNLQYATVNQHLFNIAKSLKTDYHLAVVTTASRKNCEEILRFFNFIEWFDLIVTHEDVKKTKPDPQGFLDAMSFFKTTPQETIIFEDSPPGIQAAQKTGATLFIVSSF